MDFSGFQLGQAEPAGFERAPARRSHGPRPAAIVRTALCSPERPWGVHQQLNPPACPRCGWNPETFVARKSARTQI